MKRPIFLNFRSSNIMAGLKQDEDYDWTKNICKCEEFKNSRQLFIWLSKTSKDFECSRILKSY